MHRIRGVTLAVLDASEAQRPGHAAHPSPVCKPSRQSAARWTNSFTGAAGAVFISCSYLYYYYLPHSPGLVFVVPTIQPLLLFFLILVLPYISLTPD
jgi:hypothetical protein